MAYAFLKSFGLDGEIGTFTVDLKDQTATASKGHEIVSSGKGEYQIKSSRYPFCGCEPSGVSASSYPVCEKDDLTSDGSIRSAMTLIPFNQELNRFLLATKNGRAQNYKVTWDKNSKTFTAGQLKTGVNLVEEFPLNPFSAPFAKVDAAVAAKQAYETKQIKQVFHGAEGKADIERAAQETERERQPLVNAIRAAFGPVSHTIRIEEQ